MEKQDQQKIIKVAKDFLEEENGGLFCYLFGSLACQNHTSKSDVDLAIYLDEKKCSDFFKKRLDLIAQLSKELGKEADVVILNTAPIFLRYVILKEGKLILEQNEEQRFEFELKTMREYFDFKPIMKKYYERTLNF